MKKIFFNQNIVSPYRLPLFQDLDEEYDVTVWFHREDREKREWQPDLEDYSFDHRVLKGKKLGPLVLNPGFFLKLLRKNFDVYFINENPETFIQSFAILLTAKLKRKPVIVWSEAIDTEKSRELPDPLLKKLLVKTWRGFKEAYRRVLYSYSDRFVAFSEMAKDFLEERGVSEERIDTQVQVMPEELLPEPEDHGLDEKYSGKKMILSLGYLEERKGVQDLIKAFKQVEDNDYRLVIAGKGPYKQELEQKAEGDDRIEFVGYLSEQEKANYFDAADLFVLPTHHDPWGLVVNEALHYGTPVVTTEAAGAKDIVPGKEVFSSEKDLSSLLVEDIQSFPVKKAGNCNVSEGVYSLKQTVQELT
jgi:glycosyltransferase involved in cell wall biosynthesis